MFETLWLGQKDWPSVCVPKVTEALLGSSGSFPEGSSNFIEVASVLPNQTSSWFCLSFFSLVLNQGKRQKYQGFSALAEALKPLEKKGRTLETPRKLQGAKKTKEIKKTKEMKGRVETPEFLGSALSSVSTRRRALKTPYTPRRNLRKFRRVDSQPDGHNPLRGFLKKKTCLY